MMPATRPRPAAELKAAQDWIRARAADVEGDLRLLAAAESPSLDVTLLAQCLDVLLLLLDERLGTPERIQRFPGGIHGDVAVVDFPGESPSPPVVVLCHYDTVWEAGTLAEWPFARDGDLITGPGVFDMKAGCIQGIWAVRAARECGLPLPPVRFVLTGDEEIGSPFSRPIIERQTEDAALVLVLEPGADGAAKVARKGIGRLHIEVEGVAAHAGLDYWAGTSAIDELARAVLAVHALSDPATGSTFNVGTVSGGTRANVVAESAEAEVDVRIERLSEMPRIEQQLAEIAPQRQEATMRLRLVWDRPPMEEDAATLEPFALARETAQGLGRDLGAARVGGASDGNYVAARGIPTLDGMGAVGSGAHARTEHIHLPRTIDQIALIAGVISALA
ncbi:MAG: M20 family metallopeptidase [Microbacterium sp.]